MVQPLVHKLMYNGVYMLLQYTFSNTVPLNMVNKKNKNKNIVMPYP